MPPLGAYVVSKASTFARRSGDPKGAKDLLYLHDVMEAGPQVVNRIEGDLAGIARDLSGPPHIRYATAALSLALDGAQRRLLPQAAEMLAERELGLTMHRAEADVGQLSDLLQLLQEHAD